MSFIDIKHKSEVSIKEAIRKSIVYKTAIKLRSVVNFGLPNKTYVIRGKNNIVSNRRAMHNITYNIIGDNNRLLIGNGSKISNIEIFIRGDSHTLIVGEGCIIKGGSFYFDEQNCQILIGDRTTIENADFAASEQDSKIVIGKDCMFADDIEIRTGDSHSIVDRTTGQRINHAKSVIIGEHVWVGSGVKVLKGVTISQGSVIGTGSIVTSDIPAHVVAVGVPAKVVKIDIDWLRERI